MARKPTAKQVIKSAHRFTGAGLTTRQKHSLRARKSTWLRQFVARQHKRRTVGPGKGHLVNRKTRQLLPFFG